MKVIAQLEFELAYFQAVAHLFSHYATGTNPPTQGILLMEVCVYIFQPFRYGQIWIQSSFF